MRLIDADELIELIKSHDDITLDRFSELAVCRVIREQPTAYDVEKVVTELEEELNNAKNYWDDSFYYTGKAIAYEDAIEIARKGGIDG